MYKSYKNQQNNINYLKIIIYQYILIKSIIYLGKFKWRKISGAQSAKIMYKVLQIMWIKLIYLI